MLVRYLDDSSSAKKTILNTRRSSTVFGLGIKITEEDTKINGSRLPTSRQVMRCLIYHLNEDGHKNRTRWESKKIV